MIAKLLIFIEQTTWDWPIVGNDGIVWKPMNWVINKIWPPGERKT